MPPARKAVAHRIQDVEQLLAMRQALERPSVASPISCSARMESSAAIGPGPATICAWLSAESETENAAPVLPAVLAPDGGFNPACAFDFHGRDVPLRHASIAQCG